MIPKFRAFHKTTSEMYICYGFDTFDTKDKLFICNKPSSSFKGGKVQTIHAVEVYADDYILMQSTGLKDKNGVEIYEGDVVDYFYNALSVIKFKSGCFCIVGDSQYDYFNEIVGGIEVVGSIHENPELLEVSE